MYPLDAEGNSSATLTRSVDNHPSDFGYKASFNGSINTSIPLDQKRGFHYKISIPISFIMDKKREKNLCLFFGCLPSKHPKSKKFLFFLLHLCSASETKV
jgi:hypothetical protein